MNNDESRIVANAIVEILGPQYRVMENAKGSIVDYIGEPEAKARKRGRGFLILVDSQRMLICRNFISLAYPNSLETIALAIKYCLSNCVGCGKCPEYSTIFK